VSAWGMGRLSWGIFADLIAWFGVSAGSWHVLVWRWGGVLQCAGMGWDFVLGWRRCSAVSFAVWFMAAHGKHFIHWWRIGVSGHIDDVGDRPALGV
jgi:hypothetical protein